MAISRPRTFSFSRVRVRTIERIVASVLLTLGSRSLIAAVPPVNNTGYVTVQSRPVTSHISAYARVEPIAVLTISAPETGVIVHLRVVPGMHVHKGQVLAQLTGPELEAILLQNRADLRSAQTQFSASQKVLATQRQQLLLQLATKQTVDQADAAVAQAQTNLDNTQSRLNSVRQMMIVSAPTDAIVLALSTTDGSLVTPGQAVLTLQPANHLWLKATYFGADLAGIHIGMSGQFLPSDQSAPIPIKVSAVFATLGNAGGESIAMVSNSAHPRWLNGESGTVTLDSLQRNLVAVPTRALILDQGKWWVIVHTSQGDHPQSVVPGPTQGWDTFIESGLAAGTQIVVENAYLLFHQGISQHYQIPN